LMSALEHVARHEISDGDAELLDAFPVSAQSTPNFSHRCPMERPPLPGLSGRPEWLRPSRALKLGRSRYDGEGCREANLIPARIDVNAFCRPLLDNRQTVMSRAIRGFCCRRAQLRSMLARSGATPCV
jgi:hypothetical protein